MSIKTTALRADIHNPVDNKTMELITAAGQLKQGDEIKIVGRSKRDDYESITVKEVLGPDAEEEIVINKSRNYYYITKMMLAGESWAAKVYKLS